MGVFDTSAGLFLLSLLSAVINLPGGLLITTSGLLYQKLVPLYTMGDESLRDEFYCSKLGLKHHQPELFLRSQWAMPQWLYVTWRGFWCVWHVTWIVISGVNTREYEADTPDDGVKWFVYIGNQVFLLTTVTCLMDFLLVLLHTLHHTRSTDHTAASSQSGAGEIETSDSDKDEIIFQGEFTLEDDHLDTPCSIRVVWMLYNMVNCANLLVTIMHWSVEHSGEVDAVEVALHALNTVFVVSNLLVSAMPVNILHFVYPACLALLYFTFNLVYFLCGGTDLDGSDVIFKAIDWDEAFPTVLTISLGLGVAIPLGHLGFFAIFTFRLYMYSMFSQGATDPGDVSGSRKKPKPTDIQGTNTGVSLTGLSQHDV